MRWLDRWLGVPLCFLLSFCTAAGSRSATLARPRRVLCIQLAEMGSLVLAAPAMYWLRERGLTPFFVSFARNAECIAISGLVPAGRAFLWRTDTPLLFVRDFLRFLAWAWRQRFDATIDFEPCSRFSALLGLLAGARLRAGYAHEHAYRGRLFNLPVAYRNDRHMSENCLALAAALLPGEPANSTSAELAWRTRMVGPVSAAAAERVTAVLTEHLPQALAGASLVLLNPNAGDLLPQRRWPMQRYAELARRLIACHPDVCVGLIGAPAETRLVELLARDVDSSRCASLAGTLAVNELPALFARSQVLVSNVSGPAHIASLTQTPTLVLFGPETPLLYRPLGKARALYAGLACSPCISAANQRRCACDDNRCMQAISVDAVLEEVDALLSADAFADRRVVSADS
jgi:ADP-heptose:LPS heptosyltransferase